MDTERTGICRSVFSCAGDMSVPGKYFRYFYPLEISSSDSGRTWFLCGTSGNGAKVVRSRNGSFDGTVCPVCYPKPENFANWK